MKNLAQTVMVALVLKLFSWCLVLPQSLAPSAVTVGTASQTAEETQYIRVPTSFSNQITSLQFLTLQGEMRSEEQGLPCLDSRSECVERLTQQAIPAFLTKKEIGGSESLTQSEIDLD